MGICINIIWLATRSILVSKSHFVKCWFNCLKCKLWANTKSADFSCLLQENSQNAPLVGSTLDTLLRFLNWIPLGYIFETKLITTLIYKVNTTLIYKVNTTLIYKVNTTLIYKVNSHEWTQVRSDYRLWEFFFNYHVIKKKSMNCRHLQGYPYVSPQGDPCTLLSEIRYFLKNFNNIFYDMYM